MPAGEMEESGNEDVRWALAPVVVQSGPPLGLKCCRAE